MEATVDMLAAALGYAAKGYFVFPIHTPLPSGACDCRKPDCQHVGKHPRTRNGLLDATTDEATIRQWWKQWPVANIGIACGPSGIVVIDVDPRHGGDESYADLVATHGRSLAQTLVADTGGGGAHLVWLQPAGASIGNVSNSDRFTGPLGPGVDVRGTGGYIIAPPSLHASGNRYAWSNTLEPQRLPLPLYELLTSPTRHDNGPSVSMADILGGVAEGSRDWELFRAAAKLRYADIPIEWAYQLIEAAAAACVPPFPRAEARAKVLSAYGRYEPGGVAHVAPVPSSASGPEGIQPIDWQTFWASDPKREEWLIEPIVPRGKQVALYSPPGQGKSLLSLDIAARLATGSRCLDRPAGEPVSVVYVDLEMTEGDLYERLENMGYGADTDLSRLHYYLLPSLPPLDTAAGGEALLAICQRHGAELVVIDTTSRVLSGEENDADTIRAFYRHTGMRLKGDGRTLLRLDHAGKDAEKGQRGSSAKADDVDLVWELTVVCDDARLRATKRRQSWVPELVSLIRRDEPLHHVRSAYAWPQGTKEAAEILDGLGVSLDAGLREGRAAVRGAGHKIRNNVIDAGMKWRRERAPVVAVEVVPDAPLRASVRDDPPSDAWVPGEVKI